jgi:hypothetical protein
LFISQHLILFFFVDDVCIFSHPSAKQEVAKFIENLTVAYEFRELREIKWFIGIRIVRDRTIRKLWLCQDSIIDKLAESFHVPTTKYPKTPLTTDDIVRYDEVAKPQERSLNYSAVVVTPPGLARTTQNLSKSLTNPSPIHNSAADRAVAYLAGTRTLAIKFGPNEHFPMF